MRCDTYDSFFKSVFTPRFGLLTKSELELELFRVFLEMYAGEELSDFEIGCMLGITERRVSNMRLKLNLFDGERALDPQELILGDAFEYDQDSNKVTLRIDSAFQRAALKDYLEKSGAIVDLPLGSRHITISLSKYLDTLAVVLKDSAECAKRIDALAKDQADVCDAVSKLKKKTLSEAILDSAARKELVLSIVNGAVSGIASGFVALLRGF